MLALILVALVAIIALTLLFGAAAVIKGFGQFIAWIGGMAVLLTVIIVVEDRDQFFTVLWMTLAGTAFTCAMVFAAIIQVEKRQIRAMDAKAKIEPIVMSDEQKEMYGFLLSENRFSEAERFLRGNEDNVTKRMARDRSILNLQQRGMSEMDAHEYLRLIDAGKEQEASDFYEARIPG